MARIRSIYPGIGTDEAFAHLTIAAKAALPILWTECDDHGIFEWKPFALKLRLLPLDNVDMAALLDELAEAGMIRKFADKSRGEFGAVRNFGRYQHPRQPSYRFPFPKELHSYVAFEPKPSGAPTVGLPQDDGRPAAALHAGVGVGEGEGEGGGKGKERTTKQKPKTPNPVSPSLRSGSSPASGDPRSDDDLDRDAIRKAARYYQAKALRTKRRKDPTPWVTIRKRGNKILLDPDRVKGVRLRLKDLGGLDGWRAMIDRAFASSFIAGKTGRGPGHEGWQLDFDFVLTVKGCRKIAEGKFDDVKGAGARRRMSTAEWASDLEEWLKQQQEASNGKSDLAADRGAADKGAGGAGPGTIEGSVNRS